MALLLCLFRKPCFYFIICFVETVGLYGVWLLDLKCGFGIADRVGLWWWFGMGFDYSWKWWPIKGSYATLSTDNTFLLKKRLPNRPNIATVNSSAYLSNRHSLTSSPSCRLTPPKTTPKLWTNLPTLLSLPLLYIRTIPLGMTARFR